MVSPDTYSLWVSSVGRTPLFRGRCLARSPGRQRWQWSRQLWCEHGPLVPITARHSACVVAGRGKNRRVGPPDGGNGGNGGGVDIHCSGEQHDLSSTFQRVNAGHGTPGGSRRRPGANGAEASVFVPPGTLVRVYPEAHSRHDRHTAPLRELVLDTPGSCELLAAGGLVRQQPIVTCAPHGCMWADGHGPRAGGQGQHTLRDRRPPEPAGEHRW